MPNYGITAKYQPFSFQERLAPLQMAKEEYDNVGLALANLGDEANAWQRYIDPNSRSGQTLKQYNDLLAETAGKLSQEGLRAVSRNTLFGLRRAYTNNISKINDAAKALAEMDKQWGELKGRNPSLMRSVMPTIDELVDNPSAKPHIVNGNDLYEHGVKAAAAASAREVLNPRSELGKLVRGYYDVISETGYNSEAVKEFVANAANIPELQSAITRIGSMYNIDMLEDNGTAAREWITQGILDGMGYKREDKLYQDVIGAENRALDRAKQQQFEDYINSGLPLNVRTIGVPKDRSAGADYIEKYDKYFKKDGDKYVMTDEGRQAFLNRTKIRTARYVGSQASGFAVESDYYLFGNDIHYNKDFNESDIKKVEERYTKAKNEYDAGGKYDMIYPTEYVYEVAPQDSERFLQRLRRTNKDGNLYAPKYKKSTKTDNEGNEYEVEEYVEGDAIKSADLEKGKVIGVVTGPYGTYQEVQMPSGHTYKVLFKNYNPTVDAAIKEQYTNVEKAGNLVSATLKDIGYTGNENPSQVIRELQAYAAQSEDVNVQQAAQYWLTQLQAAMYNYHTAQDGLMTQMSQYGNAFSNKDTQMPGFRN